MSKQKSFFLAGLALCLSFLSSYGQQQTAVYDNISTNLKGYYEYLPQGYPASGVRYPLIIFVHGFGERGPGTPATLPAVLRNGLPKLINDGGFPTSFTVGAQTFRFIVVSPQFAATGFPSVNDINDMINYCQTKYPIDINRIYLTGLSMGGGVSWYYPGYNTYFSSRIAATVPVCGAVDADTISQRNYANNIAATNLPVWATHNQGDPQVEVVRTNNMVRFINERATPPNPLAKKTIFPGGGHDAWTQTYSPNFRENGLNIYEWMLQYKRNFVVLPITGLTFTAQQLSSARRVQLKWTTGGEMNISGYRILRSSDGIQFSSIGYSPAAGTGGNGSSYSFIDEAPLTGRAFYRLEVQELNGSVSSSETRLVNLDGSASIIISPNPVRETMNLQTSTNLQNASLQIFSNKGQLLSTKLISGNGNITVQMGNLPPGIYVAIIKDKDQITQLKFIKQ
ncbi:MAG: T9SS type A sorting domain-containing protein [Chitinophagaceae bacterium]|nr:MAG: T9SS type A sorting domain-containing protein [Chitinophagaceae bacterium]